MGRVSDESLPVKSRILVGLRWALGILVAAVTILALLYWSVEHGIPLVEGDRTTHSGAAYGFQIGSSKAEVLHVLQQRYAKPGYALKVLWARASPLQAQLGEYEDPSSKRWSSEEYSSWRRPISEVSTLEAPLQRVDRWDIDMPASWVNSIQLTFTADRLSEIERSRWLFERP
jgi:hypothetical protein